MRIWGELWRRLLWRRKGAAVLSSGDSSSAWKTGSILDCHSPGRRLPWRHTPSRTHPTLNQLCLTTRAQTLKQNDDQILNHTEPISSLKSLFYVHPNFRRQIQRILYTEFAHCRNLRIGFDKQRENGSFATQQEENSITFTHKMYAGSHRVSFRKIRQIIKYRNI